MKFKIGQTIAPKHMVGTIVEVNDSQIVFEVRDKRSDTGKRAIKLTAEHASKLGVTLQEAAESYIELVEIVKE